MLPQFACTLFEVNALPTHCPLCVSLQWQCVFLRLHRHQHCAQLHFGIRLWHPPAQPHSHCKLPDHQNFCNSVLRSGNCLVSGELQLGGVEILRSLTFPLFPQEFCGLNLGCHVNPLP